MAVCAAEAKLAGDEVRFGEPVAHGQSPSRCLVDSAEAARVLGYANRDSFTGDRARRPTRALAGAGGLPDPLAHTITDWRTKLGQ